MMFSLFLEGVVAVLLVVTICFCLLLSRRLKRLKADEAVLRSIVADLVQSTGKAESSIRALRATAEECEHTLAGRLQKAESLLLDMRREREVGEKVLSRLAKLAELGTSGGALKAPVSATAAQPVLAAVPEPATNSMQDVPAAQAAQAAPAAQAQERQSALRLLKARAA
ncbi:MAG: DUF6468 domain-containing protein [Pseudomonadota bacterium]